MDMWGTKKNNISRTCVEQKEPTRTCVEPTGTIHLEHLKNKMVVLVEL